MKIKVTKAARGFEFGDVSNISLRNILTGISRKIYGKVTKQDMLDSLDFFDGKCPYTGKELRTAIENGSGGYAVDHIIPQSKEHCGLNIRGNLVYADAEANNKKKDMTAEDFLMNDQTVLAGVSTAERKARLEKIQEFQRINKYDPELIRRTVSPYLTKLYDEIRVEQESRIDEAVQLTGLPVLTPIQKSYVSGNTKKNSQDVPVILIPSNPDDFKEELLKKKTANITLTYADGSVHYSVWKANNFDQSSNVMGNIKSRPFWRTRKTEGLVEVKIEIL